VQRLRGGLVFKAHRLFHHSTLGLRVIKKKKTKQMQPQLGVRELFEGVKKKYSCLTTAPLPNLGAAFRFEEEKSVRA